MCVGRVEYTRQAISPTWLVVNVVIVLIDIRVVWRVVIVHGHLRQLELPAGSSHFLLIVLPQARNVRNSYKRWKSLGFRREIKTNFLSEFRASKANLATLHEMSTFMQCCGSVTFWYRYGSGSSDPYLCLTKPEGPKIYVSYGSGSGSVSGTLVKSHEEVTKQETGFSYFFWLMNNDDGRIRSRIQIRTYDWRIRIRITTVLLTIYWPMIDLGQ